jgi:uncharacterized membrane protein
LSDDVGKLGKNQAALQKNFSALKNRLERLEARLDTLDGGTPEPEVVEEDYTSKASKASKETSKPIENLGFKIFGTVGFLLILLGLFYLYRFAVDNGWIGILGRIVMGVMFSVLIIVLGEVFRRKEYERFGQLITGGGLALLYFTFYAAYAFPEYRIALGMTAVMDFVLLFIVLAIAVVLALRYDSLLLTVYAFFLGYLAPILISIVNNELSYHAILIPTLLLTIGLAIILWKKNWPIAIYPLVASYFVYMIFFFTERVVRYAPAGQIPEIVGPALFYLFIYFLVFNLLSVMLQDNKSNTQNVAVAIVNALAFLTFGLSIVWRYWESFRGVFLILIAVFFLGMTFIARERGQRNMFEAFFILCITYVTIAIPVQLNGAWIPLAWAVEGFLLVRSGLRVETRGLRVLGYIALGLAAIGALVNGFEYDFGHRTAGYVVTIIALYATANILSRDKEQTDLIKIMTGVLVGVASVLLVIAVAVEIMDYNGLFQGTTSNVRQVVLTIAWAAIAVGYIVAGFIGRSHVMRIGGLVLFAVTVLKILLIDLDNLPTIYRTVVTIIVGLIALGASFAYIKNKDRIKEYLG